MRLRQLILIGALAAAPIVAATGPAHAIRVCTCTDIVMPGGVCTQYGKCHELDASVNLPPVSTAKTCRHSRALACDEVDNSCKVVCMPKQMQQQQ